MAFNAKLKIGSKDNIDVIKCDYALHRDVDPKGRPASGVYGGTINLSVESTADTAIIEAMVNQYKPIDGAVTFKKDDEDAKMKELTWEKGYVTSFKEGIDAKGDTPMLIDFTISAQKIKIGNAEHINEWPAS